MSEMVGGAGCCDGCCESEYDGWKVVRVAVKGPMTGGVRDGRKWRGEL